MFFVIFEAQISYLMAVIPGNVFKNLQEDILRLQGFKPAKDTAPDVGLEVIKHVFPRSSFPQGAIHEFLPAQTENTAPVSGFVAGLLSSLTKNHGAVMWISTQRTLFPPALKNFGLDPDRFIFLDLKKEEDVLQAMDEALKCGALSAVVGEVRYMDFTASRRLQLAVEKSQVTGFIIRRQNQNLNTTACISRWKIGSLPSERIGELPGIGFPKWGVELLRMRNGRTGAWEIQWINGRFDVTLQNSAPDISSEERERKAV